MDYSITDENGMYCVWLNKPRTKAIIACYNKKKFSIEEVKNLTTKFAIIDAEDKSKKQKP